jgi:prevent-host-death family protein
MISNFALDNDIQPLSEFRKNTAEYIDRIRNQKKTIVLTQHGKSAAVLVNVEEYQQMLDKLDLIDELIAAETDFTNNDIVSQEEAKKTIIENLAKWK